MEDLSKETYTCDEAIDFVMECESFEKYKDEPTNYNLQFVLEDMYNIACHSGFVEGRHSMEKEWKIFLENQKKQIESLNKIAELLNVKQ